MRAVVVANGQIEDSEGLADAVGPDTLVVCADGGTANALALGLTPHVVIGDLDSIGPDLRRELQNKGVEFIAYPPRKDETDTELALRYCVARGAESILFIGALGRRLDHSLANLLLLADPAWRSIPIRIVDGPTTIQLCASHCDIIGQPGDIISLLPLGGDAKGVRTEGLEYPLNDETLFFGPARGMGNVMLTHHATVTLREGLLLVIHVKKAKGGNH